MNQATLLLVTAAVSGVVSLAVSRTTTRYDYKLARQSRAIENLAPQLYGLQDLVVLARPGMVSGRELSDAIVDWNKAWKTHRAGLPRSWGFIYREANDAIGNFAGPHIFAPIDRSALDEPLADYDWEWQTNAQGYLGHLAECVARRDDRRRTSPVRYSDWLACHDVRQH